MLIIVTLSFLAVVLGGPLIIAWDSRDSSLTEDEYYQLDALSDLWGGDL